MKIKILKDLYGAFSAGEIIDASLSPDKMNAVAYSNDSAIAVSYYWIGCTDFEIVREENADEVESVPTGPIVSLRQLLGQNVKTIEFK